MYFVSDKTTYVETIQLAIQQSTGNGDNIIYFIPKT
jgi:hypothetical protein